ncbi:MAG: UDP-N-acetylmuramoyl-L-alanyl-D-glutamate--2,6-diaminopimelate ligase, partial [Deltaproteobacteria bacterium]|nr:UDP-N-acetylmuramoyl-L-alanyl-D-glutamate--2,6-diaminopimelate ligase [Deltaproteobacteria bacterium]
MITLADIVGLFARVTLHGDPSTAVIGVTNDSRLVRKGWLFVAMRGEVADGHDYIASAVHAGAAAVLAAVPPLAEYRHVPWIEVEDPRMALGPVSALAYGHPTKKMSLVGITGTNGKTTLTFLLEAILTAAGKRPGVIGTISYRWAGKERTALHTTPEASDLQSMFAEMSAAGVTHVLTEVSSHGLHRGRLEGCHFDVGVFTNLTQDHLDYHRNLEEYYLAKRILFERLLPASQKGRTAAVVNADDAYGQRLISETSLVRLISFGTSPDCTVHPREISLNQEGIAASIITRRGSIEIVSRLTGPFNLSNILAAVAVAEVLGVPTDAIRSGIERVTAIPGRLERVRSDHGSIFVDYAHTPNALKNVLEALQMIRAGRIITVMGCGGDRDKTKRPLMGMEAAAGSDFVVITSDNPRTEDPMEIIRQVEEGVQAQGFTLCGNESN